MTASDPDAYIAAAPEALRPSLSSVRASLAEALPDAREMMRYGMPGFEIGGSIVAGYGAFSRQCGLYVQAAAIGACAEAIAAAGLKATKSGVTFSPARPMPDALVARLARKSRAALGL